MCYYITIAFPTTLASSIQTALPKGLHPLETSNSNITKLLPKDYTCRAITEEMCSCALFTPSKPGERDKEIATLRRKYKDKGWSESKIQRALADHERNMKVRREGFRDDFLSWFIATATNSSSSLFVFVHMYSGAIATEELDIGRAKVNLGEFGIFQKNFPEDVLVEITH